MKKHLLSSVTLGCLVLGCLVLSSATGVAATKKPAPEETTAAKHEKPSKPDVASPTKGSTEATTQQRAAKGTSTRKGRLPRYFGQLGLDDSQRERVYELQAEYDAKIAKLLAEIDELKKSRGSLYEKVLKPSQRDKLKELAASRVKSPASTQSEAEIAAIRAPAKKKSSGDQQ